MKKDNSKLFRLFSLFASFFKIGLFTIGGGMAMIPLIERVVVVNKKWLTSEEMIDCLAVGQGLPGVIAINTATYIGNRREGLIGAIFATLGVIMPSFIIIIILASVLDQVGSSKFLEGVFVGINSAICGLLLVTTYGMAKKVCKGAFPWIAAIASLVVVGILKVTALWAVLGAAIVGVIYLMAKGMPSEKGGSQ